MLDFVRSLAYEELAYIFGGCLWRAKLRVCFDRGMGQLGPKPHVRQIGLHGKKKGLSPSKSPETVFSCDTVTDGCPDLLLVYVASEICTTMY